MRPCISIRGFVPWSVSVPNAKFSYAIFTVFSSFLFMSLIWPIHRITNSDLEIRPVKAHSTEALLRASVELEFVLQWIDS